MIRNKILSRFIVVTLTAALLLISGSRAIRVSALAELAPDVAPVFDTQIYQLQDYIDNGGLTDPQYDIFMMLAGMYALAQSGSQSLQLRDPFQYEDGVWNWLKSLGIKTYNSLINLLPDTARMPVTGQIFSTIPFKNASALYVASLMGMAIEAKSFDTVQEFKDEVASGSYYLPWNMDIQKGMNSIFGIYGGIYEWQFDSSPFPTDFLWKYINISGTLLENYNSSIENNLLSPVHINAENSRYFAKLNAQTTLDHYDLFLNTTENTVKLVDSSGNNPGSTFNIPIVYIQQDLDDYSLSLKNESIDQITFMSRSLSLYGSYDTYIELVREIFNSFDDFSIAPIVATINGYQIVFDPTYIINHVYIGSNWLDKREIFNLTDLNFDEPDVSNDNDYYVTVPDDTNYLLDIHNLVHDLVDNSDLFQIIINHIVDKDGVQVHDDQLIRITTSIYDLLQETNPVLPVNLNDVAEYTDNTYMDLVKERATSAGSALAALVAFWHNCDAELIYVMFGAGLTVLVGAFIGKWGHS